MIGWSSSLTSRSACSARSPSPPSRAGKAPAPTAAAEGGTFGGSAGGGEWGGATVGGSIQSRLQQLMAAAPGNISVTSGTRTREQQDAAVAALRFKTEVLWAQLDAIERGDTQPEAAV